MALTHIEIAHTKPAAKPYKLTDADGLYLVVQPTGAKLWRMKYRHGGRQRTLYFSAWPDLSIVTTRVKRDEARSQLAQGVDPATEKKAVEMAERVAASNTFKAVAEEWAAKIKREGRAPVTLDKVRWLLSMAYPLIGHLPVSKVTPQEALAVLRKVEATGL